MPETETQPEGAGAPVVFALPDKRAETAARWVELAAGVRVKLKARTGIMDAAIESRTGRVLVAFAQGEDILGPLGFNPGDSQALADLVVATSFAEFLSLVVAGSILIDSWNLIDPAGMAIPVTIGTVAALLSDGPSPGAGAAIMAALALALEEG